jgi:hypothetical protein
MKILFVENRGKTAFWQHVALDLQQRGHQVAWIVQNPGCAPPAFSGSTHLHVLAFPPAGALGQFAPTEAWVQDNFPALVTDRGRTHFGAGAAHYAHYTEAIGRVLELERPDLVVGEATLFHELITVALCRDRGINYIQPCSNRYPSGRFSLFAFDTQLPVAGSGETWPEAKARDLVERIVTGREIPFYMHMPKRLEKIARQTALAKARASVWLGRLRGERYNTPALLHKLRLARKVTNNLQRWQALQKLPSDPAQTLLYPMQMQPEANIDVWGRPYSDQVVMITAMLAAAPPEVQVAVKVNPKSKYEVSDELIALAAREPRVCLLPLKTPMARAQAISIGTLTVTGTVGFEAVMGKGRALSLCHPMIEREFPRLHAVSIPDGVHRLLSDPSAGVGSTECGVRLIQYMVAHSFPGLVSEPLYHPYCIEQDNVRAVADALYGLSGASKVVAPLLNSNTLRFAQ